MAQRREQIIREYDDERRLTVAGFRWHEVRYPVWNVFGGVAVTAAIVFPGTVALAPSEYTNAVIGSAVGVAAVCWTMIARYGRRPRALIFYRDGRMAAPFGLPLRWRQTQLPISYALISSIEVYRAGINLYSTEGEIVRISSNILGPIDHLAAVQLTKALREMRESVSLLRTAQAGQRPAKRAPVFID